MNPDEQTNFSACVTYSAALICVAAHVLLIMLRATRCLLADIYYRSISKDQGTLQRAVRNMGREVEAAAPSYGTQTGTDCAYVFVCPVRCQQNREYSSLISTIQSTNVLSGVEPHTSSRMDFRALVMAVFVVLRVGKDKEKCKQALA
ncbi:hypothetical protein VOLCADRAFT_96019 [Volvox carteri f. nagariensis]|uniref:Uncharacterized protein n=1 Tax=Volvox carteri f. nagariensis TaxID=3068 RepID=D8U8Z9_VOLCA|nr:uncharacterized protein VOLCADRAFT_96019 [Volvox carteri f. nagariensis]EFJ43835.1 hypothetical protein VOLCADRAFT_96019 [Volvox carteri f. nagariensis]|eukprot:XP_002955081.1 hypothetical protein VOLCADRAFT_96019 [Volvox carteri f. nagariensis]